MQKETISDSQGFSMITLFLMGSSLILGVAGEASNDSWLAILIGMVMSMPIIFVYGRLIKLFPGRDIFDILYITFGKILGSLFTILYTWYFLHLGSLVMRNFGEFMNTLAFPETPIIVPMAGIGLLCVFASKYGIEVLGRTSKVLLIVCFTVLIIINLLSIPLMKPHYMKPILGRGWGPVLSGAFSAFAFPFAETVVLTGVSYSLKRKNSSYRVLFSALLITGLIMSITALRNIFVLGHNVLSHLYFPSYIAVSRLKVGNFLERMEVSVSIVFVTSIFIKISVCLTAASNGIGKLFKLKNYKSVILQTGLIMIYLAYFIYDSTMEMEYWAIELYKYYAIPFQVIIPIITIIAVEAKRKKVQLPSN